MKRIFTITVVLFISASTWAQSPEKMSYQAVIRNSSNVLVTGQNIGMQISILQGSISGTAVYTETQTPTTNTNGLVSLEIGSGTTSDDFSTIDWTNGSYFIKTETDPTGGSTYTITGTSQLMSVPYALYAKTSGSSTPGPQGPVGATGPQGPAGPTGALGNLIITTSTHTPNATYSNHPNISFALTTGTYKIDALFDAVDPSNEDLDLRFAYSGTVTSINYVIDNSVYNTLDSDLGSSDIAVSTSGGSEVLLGYIVVSNAGTLTIQFKNDNFISGATSIRPGSAISLIKLN